MKRLQPVEFVAVFFGIYRLPIWDVGTNDAYAIYRCGDDAFLRIVKTLDIKDDLAQWQLAEYGNAVVGLLSVVHGVITRRADFGIRKGLVLLLGFLQTQNVRLFSGQPVEHMRQADFERIDIPGGNLHRMVSNQGRGLSDDAMTNPGFAVVTAARHAANLSAYGIDALAGLVEGRR